MFKVRLMAFGKPGEIREVQIPSNPEKLPNLLEEVFKYGQNDFQPQQHPSVGAGDVIEIEQDLYLICAVGFRKITEEEFKEYENIPRRDRCLYYYTKQPNV